MNERLFVARKIGKDTIMTTHVTVKDLFEAGVHYGHSCGRWNPKMKPFIYGVRNGTHIIDIQKTVPLLEKAFKELENIAAKNGRILFVATKANAQEIIKETAQECGQYYVNHRWLGGTLTNWKTIMQSIKRLSEIEKRMENVEGLKKKEVLKLKHEHANLERVLGGIRKMGGLPSAIFVIDTVKEKIAVEEAKKLGIPVFGIIDSNANPEGIAYPIPGNDDAIRAIKLYCQLAKEAVLKGLQKSVKFDKEQLEGALPVDQMQEIFTQQDHKKVKQNKEQDKAQDKEQDISEEANR